MPSSVRQKVSGGGIRRSSEILMPLNTGNSGGFAKNTPSTTIARIVFAFLLSLQNASVTMTFKLLQLKAFYLPSVALEPYIWTVKKGRCCQLVSFIQIIRTCSAIFINPFAGIIMFLLDGSLRFNKHREYWVIISSSLVGEAVNLVKYDGFTCHMLKLCFLVIQLSVSYILKSCHTNCS